MASAKPLVGEGAIVVTVPGGSPHTVGTFEVLVPIVLTPKPSGEIEGLLDTSGLSVNLAAALEAVASELRQGALK